MPNQTSKESYSYPDGLRMDISIDAGSSWEDAGVLADGVGWTFNYDLSEVENGNAANPDAQAKNLSVAITPSALRTWDSNVMEKISAGLMSREAVPGTLVSGATQITTEGNWSFQEGISLEGQNSDSTVPTINSVTGSVDGAGAADDYDVVKGTGGWMVVPKDGTNFATEAQDITIDYDYTPAAGSYLYAGTSSKVLDYFMVRLRHYTDDAFIEYDYEVIFYRVRPDAGAIVMTKGGALSGNTLDEWTVAMTAEIESGNADGRQLFRIYEKAAA